MAFEMICGQCRGNLLVEHFGVVVACPHCGAHLHIPAPDAPPTSELIPDVPTTVPPSQPESVAVEQPTPVPPPSDTLEAPPSPSTEELRVFTGNESEPPPSVEISVVPSIAVSDEPEPQAPV